MQQKSTTNTAPNPVTAGEPIAPITPAHHQYTKHYLIAIVILIVMASIVVIIVQRTSFIISTPTPISQKPTSIGLNTVKSFLNNFSVKTPLNYLGIFTYSSSICDYTEYSAEYAQAGVPIPPAPINFSKLNESQPIFISFTVAVINQSFMPSYMSKINASGGFCIPSMYNISKNSTYSHSILTISGVPSYLMNFSNFTDEGLNLTYNYYIGGKRPNLEWSVIKTIYKNTAIITGIWSFKGYANGLLLKNYSEQFYNSYISKVGNT